LFRLFKYWINRDAPGEKKTLTTLNKIYYFLHQLNRETTEIEKYFYLFGQNGVGVLSPL